MERADSVLRNAGRDRLRAAALALGLAACAQPTPAPESAPAATARAAAAEPTIEVTATHDDTPAGGDGAPRLSLAFRMADGSLRPIAGQATAFVPFRGGAALVEPSQQLVLVSPAGDRRVLARKSGAPPRRGSRGELIYVALYDQGAELHELELDGRDRILAGGLRSIGVMAPQPDGRLFFVAVGEGGVAGLWLEDAGRARCLTNCDLVAGKPWGDRFLPLPTSAEALRVAGDTVEWDAADGSHRSIGIAARGAAPIPALQDAGAPSPLGTAP